MMCCRVARFVCGGHLDDRKWDHMLSGNPGTRVFGVPGSDPLKSRLTRWRAPVQSRELAGTRRVAPLVRDTSGVGVLEYQAL